MDIVELSRKMEADLLESHSNKSSFLKSVPNENFSPRITRSQVNLGQKQLMEESNLNQLKRNHDKVNEIEKIFQNKKAKRVHKNLETIYEDPIWKKGSAMLLGTNKVKRSIYLDREFRITSKQKSKLRKMKIKRLGNKKRLFKMSDEEFKKKMLKIENFINDGNDAENEDCDVEFDNCDNNKICSDLENGNIMLYEKNKTNAGENQNSGAASEFVSE